MHKKAILFLVLVLSKFSFSQKYRPFDSTTVWSSEYSYKYYYNCYVQQNTKTYMKGYVVDLGRVWYKLYCTTVSQINPFSFCSSGPPPLPPPSYNTPCGYLFNDTTNKKVYVIGSAPSNYTLSATDMLYDFNKTAGDTFFLKNVSYTTPYYKFKINSIDSILFSGNYHKRYLVTCMPSAIAVPNPASFVEGIGSSLGPFWQLINGMGEAYTTLNCFASPTHTMAVSSHTAYTTSSFCNGLVLGIESEAKPVFSIYPNPASDFISIQNAENNTKYRVYDLTGRIMLEGEIKKDGIIYTLLLNSGIYYITFSNGLATIVEKLVIQKE